MYIATVSLVEPFKAAPKNDPATIHIVEFSQAIPK